MDEIVLVEKEFNSLKLIGILAELPSKLVNVYIARRKQKIPAEEATIGFFDTIHEITGEPNCTEHYTALNQAFNRGIIQ